MDPGLCCEIIILSIESRPPKQTLVLCAAIGGKVPIADIQALDKENPGLAGVLWVGCSQVARLRLAIPSNPIKPLPNNQTAAGIGTAPTSPSRTAQA